MAHSMAYLRFLCVTLLTLVFYISNGIASSSFVTKQEQATYQACVHRLKTNTQDALSEAKRWTKLGSSPAAYHCKAMAEFRLRQFSHAATTLQQLHDMLPAEHIRIKNNVMIQAIRSWRLAREYPRAKSYATRFIRKLHTDKTFIPYDMVSALIERSKIHMVQHEWLPALQDLDHAVALQQQGSTALLLRAKLYQAMNEQRLAQQDALTILARNPNHVKARLLLSEIMDAP